MAHGNAREGKWRGNWRMECLATPFPLPRNMVYSALLPLMRTPRLPVVDWTDAPADLNGLVRFAERRNLVSVYVPSHFKRSLLSMHLVGDTGGWRGAGGGDENVSVRIARFQTTIRKRQFWKSIHHLIQTAWPVLNERRTAVGHSDP